MRLYLSSQTFFHWIGYVSDGDVLQSNVSMSGKLYNDVDGGYMSEGGAQFYERYSNNLEMK